jgi:hypothetical protein
MILSAQILRLARYDVAQSFSQRMGFRPVKSIIQVDTMDDELRTAIWNVLTEEIWNHVTVEYSYINDAYFLGRNFTDNIWVNFLKKTIDTKPETKADFLKQIRPLFFKFEWYRAYDFIEFVAQACYHKATLKYFIKSCNAVLARELSAYRFVGEQLVPVTSDKEIEAIEKAL